MTQLDAVNLCTKFEDMLRDKGWHIGLTGSFLYGPINDGGDMDIIIYPHIPDDGIKSILTPEQVLSLLGITDISHTKEDQWYGGGHVDYIYVGKHEDIKVDAFFLK